MSNSTYDNFVQAAEQFTPTEFKQSSHRLYYDDLGDPLFYSMEDLPGNYIEVTPAVFAVGATNCRVVDGTLVVFKTTTPAHKLTPGETGQACHPQDVAVVVDQLDPHTKWSLQ